MNRAVIISLATFIIIYGIQIIYEHKKGNNYKKNYKNKKIILYSIISGAISWFIVNGMDRNKTDTTLLENLNGGNDNISDVNYLIGSPDIVSSSDVPVQNLINFSRLPDDDVYTDLVNF